MRTTARSTPRWWASRLTFSTGDTTQPLNARSWGAKGALDAQLRACPSVRLGPELDLRGRVRRAFHHERDGAHGVVLAQVHHADALGGPALLRDPLDGGALHHPV